MNVEITEELLNKIVDALVELPFHRVAPVLDDLGAELSGSKPVEEAPQIVTAH